MKEPMTIILEAILAYLINLASGERSAAIAASRERKLKEALEQEEALKKALASTRSVRDEVRATCIELARSRTRLGVTPQEEPVWRLLSDDSFQTDLTEWLMAGGIAEGNAAKDRLLRAMELALSDAGVSPEQITFLKTGYFDALEKAVFASPILAHWRHQLSLDYLREQVAVLRRRAEEAAGVFSPEKQKAALDRYCEKALNAWDIIDLCNLPEGDIHMATQKLLLRQLYMPLRIEVEPTKQGEGDDAALARLEEQREIRRHREAGHLLTDEHDRPSREISRAPVGERLTASSRLVVLGDPGGGKTTMLRWMATAYLLRHKGDAAFSQVPDSQTLPNKPWIPVLIRCRDLGEQDLCRCFTDFLTQHLNKTELLPAEAEVMRAVILDRIAKGEALLLVDGLDEITNPRVRMMFCQELERTAARYPAPIVVTSRIVGYRDMPYRMGSGFEHGQIAELNREDKDLFARRWVEVTEQHQSTDEKAKRAQELLDALHSNDRIERLTGNPMLLTTLALVKRKVGKLPNRRSDLYAEAVQVLLNFNPRYRIIDKAEAIPQIAYLAYEMCRLGVQQLTEDQVLEQLDKFRHDYPNVRSVRVHEPHSFLELLEAQSSILIKSGSAWQRNSTVDEPVWEFRHLTFQEYLAARALLDGRYPGRDKAKTLAEHVAPLAGAVQKTKSRRSVLESEEEVEVPESWREALRLLVADCNDDDVDDVLQAILTPTPNEDAGKTSRPRAVLAALCLADEPNVSEATATCVLQAFVERIGPSDGLGHLNTPLDAAAMAVGGSHWAPLFTRLLVTEFCKRIPVERERVGALCGMVEVGIRTGSSEDECRWLSGLESRLKSGNPAEVTSAALAVTVAAFKTVGELAITQRKIAETLPSLAGVLITLLKSDVKARHAVTWALFWLSGGSVGEQHALWRADSLAVAALNDALITTPSSETRTREKIVTIIGASKNPVAVAPLLAKLDDQDTDVRRAVIEALVKLGDQQAVAPLLAKLDDQSKDVRQAVIEALGQLGDKQAVAPLLAKLDDQNPANRASVAAALHALREPMGTAALKLCLTLADAEQRQTAVRSLARGRDDLDQRLLSRDLDAADPWLDPQESVTDAQVTNASSRLNLTPDQVRSRYEALAVDLNLKLSWKN